MPLDHDRFNKTVRVGIVVFLMLSLADFFLTWRLVSTANSGVDEINPIASWVLDLSGWIGLASYKVTLVCSIGIAVLVIASRRSSLGASVIMFGCGAQACVVLTGAMLLRGHAPTNHELPDENPSQPLTQENTIFPPGAFLLLNYKSIQQELGLSAAVINDIEDIAQRRIEMKQRLRNDNLTDGHDIFFELYGRERLLAASLTPRQAKRLHELSLQIRAEIAFLDQEVTEVLEFSDSQVEEVSNIIREFKLYSISIVAPRDGSAPSFKGLGNMSEARVRLAALLDADQKNRWRALQGDPFVYTSNAAVSDVPTASTAD